MQHTEATLTRWYEGVALRKDMLTVVQRINDDLSSGKLHISNTKQVHCTFGTSYNAHTVSEKWPPTQQRNTSLNAKPKQLSIYNFINRSCDVFPRGYLCNCLLCPSKRVCTTSHGHWTTHRGATSPRLFACPRHPGPTLNASPCHTGGASPSHNTGTLNVSPCHNIGTLDTSLCVYFCPPLNAATMSHYTLMMTTMTGMLTTAPHGLM